MKKFLIFLLLVTFLTGCKNDDNTGSTQPVNIRLKNVSSARYSNILVNINGDEVAYPDLEPQQVSNYNQFTSAYRYAYIYLIADEVDTLIFQPIDFVGESLLPAGNYTYEVGITENQQYLTISLAVD